MTTNLAVPGQAREADPNLWTRCLSGRYIMQWCPTREVSKRSDRSFHVCDEIGQVSGVWTGDKLAAA